MKILTRLERNKSFWFLLIASFIFFLLRFPSLFEPYWYGDEGIYQVIGIAIRNGRLLYRDIFDNKPPFLYFLYALFNSDQFTLRLVSLIFGILSVIVFFFLAKKIFSSGENNQKIVLLTTSLFAFLFAIPFFEGNIANAENFMILPILFAALLLVNYLEPVSKRGDEKILNSSREAGSRSAKQIFFVGLLLGVSFLFKIVAIFDLGAFVVFWGFLNFSKIKDFLKTKKNIISEFKELLLILLGFFIPFAITALFFLLNGALSDFITAIFFSNIGYVAYANELVIPQGFLFIKLVLLLIFVVFLFNQQKKLKSTEVFILLWFGFSLFNGFFSGRPYTHYILVLLPSFSLMLGFLFCKKSVRKISLVLLIASILIINKNFTFFGYKKTIAYYKNFISFIAGQKTVSSYQRFFDKKTPIDYEIAQFIKSRQGKDKSVFIWGNNAQVYKMIGVLPPGKYIVKYHITNYKDGLSNTKKAFEKRKPEFIAIMPNQPPIPFPLINYSYKITIDNVTIYERIF